MATARYWRLVALSVPDGADLSVSEVVFSGAAGGVTALATVTCSHAPVSGDLANLQDGDFSTAARFAGGDVRSGGFWIAFAFGVPVDINRVALGGADRALYPSSATVQAQAGGAWGDGVQLNWAAYPGDGLLGDFAGLFVADLLLHFDALVDSGGGGKTVALTSGASLNGADKALGTASLLISGVSASAQVPHSASWDFGGDDFIVDFRFFASTPYVNYSGIVVHDNIAVARGWLVFLSGGDDGAAGTLNAAFFQGATAFVLRWPTLPAANTWYRASVRRVLGVFELWVDQVRVAVDAAHPSFVVNNVTAPLTIGNLYLSGVASNSPLYGRVDELVIIKGEGSSRIDPSVPREAPYGDDGLGIPQPHFSRSLVAASAGVPGHHAPGLMGLQLARDVEHGGPGTIYGTTKTKGTPNAPTKARVVLLHQRSKQPVRETWSDPVTGAFAFTGIDTTQQFLTLAEDAAGNFRPVAASRLVPEVLP